MVNVVGVRFKAVGKIYYFDPADFDIQQGQHVIVETARGMEYGEVITGPKDVHEKEIVAPLKKVIRIADEKDDKRHMENINKKARALALCQEKVDKHKLDMKLIDVEYTFDNSKIIFYFTSDGRVDFRELVKDLAAVFKMRIELRQIGVRDEAKMVGGIGTCGKGLCCNTWLPEFDPVSIKMAKVQNLSLNPTKISGICGRLMCCLKYENDAYNDLRRGMPDVGEKVDTENGLGIVVETNTLRQQIKVRIILEGKNEDSAEKLSSDIYTFKKGDIRRVDPKKNKNKEKEKDILAELDEQTLGEIKDLLED